MLSGDLCEISARMNKNTLSLCALVLSLGAAAIAPSYGQDSGTVQTVPSSVLQNDSQTGSKKRHASPGAIKKLHLSVLKKRPTLTAAH